MGSISEKNWSATAPSSAPPPSHSVLALSTRGNADPAVMAYHCSGRHHLSFVRSAACDIALHCTTARIVGAAALAAGASVAALLHACCGCG